MFRALALLREIGHLWRVWHGALLGGTEKAILDVRAAPIFAGRPFGGWHGRGRLVRRVILRRRTTLRCDHRRVCDALISRAERYPLALHPGRGGDGAERLVGIAWGLMFQYVPVRYMCVMNIVKPKPTTTEASQ